MPPYQSITTPARELFESPPWVERNHLFVGHDQAGQNAAVLYTLVSTCEANDVNPIAYLTDVLIRIQTHPQSAINELLPHKWKPPDEPSNTTQAPP